MIIKFNKAWGGFSIDIYAKTDEKPIIKVGKEVLVEGKDYDLEEEAKPGLEIQQASVDGVVKLS